MLLGSSKVPIPKGWRIVVSSEEKGLIYPERVDSGICLGEVRLLVENTLGLVSR